MTTAAVLAARQSRPLSPDQLERERALRGWLRDARPVLLGFSGGVDSAYLAAVAIEELGPDDTVAVIGVSSSFSDEQHESARDFAARYGIPLLEVPTDELADPEYAANPVNRCYYCKRELWDKLVPLARARGIRTILDGTNADDLGDYRPGGDAARERGIRSPLAELGFSKEEIRSLSRARGLPTWNVPSSPCLSSRIPYGTSVTTERLMRIGRAERSLRALGIEGDLRVRDHDDLARVELNSRELERWLAPPADELLCAAVREAGFSRVTLDLRGFASGSLNVLAGLTGE